jgi:2-keto-4-pentenoate hydratase/2-oxohepta-3-ene-1,7-dioic acid hydratase in catechol pathway
VRWRTYVGEDGVARRGLERGPAAPRARAGRPSGPLGDDGTRLRQAAERARQESAVDPAVVRLLPPVPRPPSVRDFMAFEEDVVTASAAVGGTVDPLWYRQPVFYFSNPASLLGAHDPVAVSPGNRAFDYELEVAAVIGREGADLSPEEAIDHGAGYVLFCDWSAREV